ncbi:PREDICTED: zinc finger MYM-type protein 5-like, partial [Amphimedon queenslandica]|uniref:TTF-type domain-containing protein n=1 Tax=Amphimedon queenslandica TaxID=400682 RepID=A0A1X7SFX8_AMPQE
MAKRQSSLQDFFSKKRLVEVQESESNIDINDGSFSLDSEGCDPDLSLPNPLPSTSTSISIISSSLTDTTSQTMTSSSSVGSDVLASVKTTPGSSHSALPSDISQSSLQGPVQPKSFKFPASVFGSVHRSFNGNWFEKYPWLEYSILQDAAFCFPCRFFAVPDKGRAENTFTRLGYRDWKHATGRCGVLEKHNTSHSHHEATISWQDFKLNIEK